MAQQIPKEPPLGVVILAAGKGKRMKNPDMAKVMHQINDRPMVDYVLDLATTLKSERTILVVGWQKDAVIAHVKTLKGKVDFVHQVEQLGTGHAVLQTREALSGFDGDVLVLSGDVPLLTEKTLKALLGYHRATSAVATILTAELDDPTGYGRIIRNKDESVKKIVEHKEATEKEREIGEINSGIYVFDTVKLFEALEKITPENAQGEYYLTDVFEHFWKKEWKVSAVKALDPQEVMGINDVDQLEEARTIMASRGAG
jgi:UDP-N-acetylglucosamine pyrophosphorylase